MALVGEKTTQEELEALLNPAPKGKYRAKVVGYRMGSDGQVEQNSEKCAGYIKPVFVITEEGPHAGKFAEYFVITLPKSKAYAQMLRAFPQANVGGQLDTDLTIQSEAIIAVKVRSYEGNESNEVTAVFALPVGGAEKNDEGAPF